MNEVIKPIMNCTLGMEYLTKNSKASSLRKYGHEIVSVKVKGMNIPGFGTKRTLNHTAKSSGILKTKNDVAGEFSVRHTTRCSLFIQEHRVNDIGFDNYLTEIQHLINTSRLISADTKAAMKKNLTSSYHIINITKLVTRNLKTDQICVWKPTETLTGKNDKIIVLVLVSVDGEKLEDVPKARKANCWTAAGAIAVKACHMTSKIVHNMSCDLITAAKAKKIK